MEFSEKQQKILHWAVGTVWKNEKLSLTQKIFRQINSLVTYLVKSLLSRNFYQKCKKENSRDFHTTVHTVEITGIYSHAFLAKISWKHRIY